MIDKLLNSTMVNHSKIKKKKTSPLPCRPNDDKGEYRSLI